MIALDRDEWLAERRTGLGGSDAAAAAGLNPYKTRTRLYQEKRGEIPEEDLSEKPQVRWGNRLEDLVADEYEEQTGRRVARVNRILRHPLLPHMLGNLDRRVYGERRGLEVKTAGFWAAQSDAWGPAGTDQVPVPYLVQCQHYMAVTGWDAWDLAVLIAGQDFRIYTIPRDETLIGNLVAVEERFWRDVQNGTPPAPSTVDEALERFPISMRLPVEATPEVAELARRYRALKGAEKTNEGELDQLKAQIAAYLGERDELTIDGIPVLTWRTKSTGKRFDARRFAIDHPELHEQYIVEGSTREMRLKKES